MVKQRSMQVESGSQNFLKEIQVRHTGDCHFFRLIFSRSIVFTFQNDFALWKMIFYICRKIIFSATIIL